MPPSNLIPSTLTAHLDGSTIVIDMRARVIINGLPYAFTLDHETEYLIYTLSVEVDENYDWAVEESEEFHLRKLSAGRNAKPLKNFPSETVSEILAFLRLAYPSNILSGKK